MFLLQFFRELLVSPIFIFILVRCTYFCKTWLNRTWSIPDIFKKFFLDSGQMDHNIHKKSIRFRLIDIYHFLYRMFLLKIINFLECILTYGLCPLLITLLDSNFGFCSKTIFQVMNKWEKAVGISTTKYI